MALLKDIQKGLYNRKINQCIQAPIKRQPKSFSQAKSIGLVFHLLDESTERIVLNYKRELQALRKKVSILAYVDKTVVPEGLAYPCFCQKDLGMNLTPQKHEGVQTFIQQPFDIIIALHMQPCLSLEYVTAASKAHFRIGPYQEEQSDIYDFMLYGKSKSLRAFISLVNNYLKTIN